MWPNKYIISVLPAEPFIIKFITKSKVTFKCSFLFFNLYKV